VRQSDLWQATETKKHGPCSLVFPLPCPKKEFNSSLFLFPFSFFISPREAGTPLNVEKQKEKRSKSSPSSNRRIRSKQAGELCGAEGEEEVWGRREGRKKGRSGGSDPKVISSSMESFSLSGRLCSSFPLISRRLYTFFLIVALALPPSFLFFPCLPYHSGNFFGSLLFFSLSLYSLSSAIIFSNSSATTSSRYHLA